MLKSIKRGIKNRQLILIGEDHGTKIIPKTLSKFFINISKNTKFNLIFEIPKDYKKRRPLGMYSKWYGELIKDMQKRKIKINLIDFRMSNQNEFEEKLSKKIPSLPAGLCGQICTRGPSPKKRGAQNLRWL